MSLGNTLSPVSRKQKSCQWETATCSISISIVKEPDKACPAWVALGDVYSPDYCRQITLFFNSSLWPTAGAVQRRDFRVLRWLGACALLERLAVSQDPLPKAACLGLATLALGRSPETHERCNWAAYQLMDCELFQKLETFSIFDGPTDGKPTVLGSFSYKFRNDVWKEWLAKYPPPSRKRRIQK